MSDLADLFTTESRRWLTERYLPKIEASVRQLSDEQIWARANEASNSIGNLLLHLAGSTRYWAAEVIGGTATGRDRQGDFDERDPIPGATLLTRLQSAVEVADAQLATLSADQLLERRMVRDEELTVLWVVYHIVEHFAMHTGQILSMSKTLVEELR